MKVGDAMTTMAVLRFAAHHGEKIEPDSYYGDALRTVTITTVGNKYAPGKVYTFRRIKALWHVDTIGSVPVSEYRKEEVDRELQRAAHSLYTALAGYNEYVRENTGAK